MVSRGKGGRGVVDSGKGGQIFGDFLLKKILSSGFIFLTQPIIPSLAPQKKMWRLSERCNFKCILIYLIHFASCVTFYLDILLLVPVKVNAGHIL